MSTYETDAYARWVGARLSSKFEWETVGEYKRRQFTGIRLAQWT